jgi:hypothetical protein
MKGDCNANAPRNPHRQRPQLWGWIQDGDGILVWDSHLIGFLVSIPLQAILLDVCSLVWAHQVALRVGAWKSSERRAQEEKKGDSLGRTAAAVSQSWASMQTHWREMFAGAIL